MTNTSGQREEPQADNGPTREPKQSVDFHDQVAALRRDVYRLQEDVKEARKDSPTKLETAQRIATISAAMLTLLTLAVAAYSFTYNGEMQAEDAANRAIQDHMRLRATLPSDMNEWLYTLAASPDEINDDPRVTNAVFTQYDSVADHGISTVEWIYRTRVTRNTVKGFIPLEWA